MSSEGRKTSSGVIASLMWTFMERITNQLVGVIISVILARLILPEAYGIVSAVQIFTSIATMFATGGLSSALIRKKDADDLDYSSMFYFNTIFSVVIYLVVFMLAPFLVRVMNNSYDYDVLTVVLRVQSLSVLFSSFNSFYRSRLEKALEFKKTFLVTFSGTAVSGIFGIWMAYAGYGVWAIVGHTLMSLLINSFMLIIFSRWHPKKQFSWRRLKPMLSYGFKLGASSLLTTSYQEMNSLAVGNQYASESLAFYTKGIQFPKLFVSNIISAINIVMFPVMSTMSKRDEYIDVIKKMNKMGSFIIAPMMFGLAAVAPRFVEILLGVQWIGCVPFLQLACLDYALQPIGLSNLQYWKATGRANLYLIADIIKKIVGTVLLILALVFSDHILSILICQIIATVIGVIINMVPQGKFLGYTFWKQVRDVLPQYILSFLMFLAVFGLGNIIAGNVYIVLLIQVMCGALLYLGLAKIFNMSEIDMAIGIIKSRLKKK